MTGPDTVPLLPTTHPKPSLPDPLHTFHRDDEVINLSIVECLDCMSIVEQQQAQALPNTPLKSYACSDYCQNPDYYPTGSEF